MKKVLNVEKYYPALIVVEGRVYKLKAMTRNGIEDSCSLCDLRSICELSYDGHKLVDLCMSDGRNAHWYFERVENPQNECLGEYLKKVDVWT